MLFPERRAWLVFVATFAQTAAALAVDEESNLAPPRVTVVLVGPAREEATLHQRIRSLFDPSTDVELGRSAQLVAERVLNPPEPNTVYLWVTLSHAREAWLYASVRETEPTSVRYLLQRIDLETGLDEVGCETLAQIAHSSATALFARLGATARDTMEQELSRNAEATPETPPPVQKASFTPKARPTTSPAPVDVMAGVQLGAHRSGGEGWLLEPGLFVGISAARHLTFHVTSAYLAEKQLKFQQSDLELRGALVEGRLGWRMEPKEATSLRGELGAGVLFANWHLRLLENDGLSESGWDERPYLVGTLGLDSVFGPLGVGVRLELRVPFHKTDYAVEQINDRHTLADSWLNPGLVLELGSRVTRW